MLASKRRQIVPMGASALLLSKIIKGATLKVIPGAPHGMCSTLKNQVDAELLTFLKTYDQASAWPRFQTESKEGSP